MRDPAEGTATVVSYSEQHEQKGNDVVLDAQVMVQAEGLVPTTVNARPRFPQSWMPVKLGTEWPVRVDRANPERLEFLFDRVTGPAGATAPAPPAPAPPGLPGPVVARSVQTFSLPPQIQVMGATNIGPEQYKQAIDMAERATGMDLDGDGKVAGGAAPAGGSPMSAWMNAAQQAYSAYSVPPTPAPARASDDPVSKLERLAKLLDAGTITRDEFDAEKKKILGS
jgi:hypothetical protein